jgi:hypothetical protein
MVIKRVKGDTYSLDITITNTSDEPIDLTGCTLFFTVKRNLQDTDAQAIINKTITSFTSSTTGDASITFNALDVDYVGEFYYDVKIKSSTGIISSVINDKFILLDHVTIRTT